PAPGGEIASPVRLVPGRKPGFARSGSLWGCLVVGRRVLLMVLLARAVMMMMVVRVVVRRRQHGLRSNERGRERERTERRPYPGCIHRGSSFSMERRPGWSKG